MPPWAALAVGAAAGLLTPLAIFTVDRLLRWDDPAAVLTVHGLGGALGLVALGIFADGKAGAGWNGVGVDSYLGVAGQGVTGLLAAAGYQPDWPAQMQAQAVGLAALALFGFFVAWLLLAPPAILSHLLRAPARRRATACYGDARRRRPLRRLEPDPPATAERSRAKSSRRRHAIRRRGCSRTQAADARSVQPDSRGI